MGQNQYFLIFAGFFTVILRYIYGRAISPQIINNAQIMSHEPERTTSFAKTVDLGRESSSLDKMEQLNVAFRRLQEIRETDQSGSSERQPETHRVTSAAKEHFPEGLNGSSLENVQPVTSEFSKAAHAFMETAQSSEGSKMVEDDKPKPVPDSPRETANQVDRQSFDERWTEEQDRANALNKATERAAAIERMQKSIENSPERGLNH